MNSLNKGLLGPCFLPTFTPLKFKSYYHLQSESSGCFTKMKISWSYPKSTYAKTLWHWGRVFPRNSEVYSSLRSTAFCLSWCPPSYFSSLVWDTNGSQLRIVCRCLIIKNEFLHILLLIVIILSNIESVKDGIRMWIRFPKNNKLTWRQTLTFSCKGLSTPTHQSTLCIQWYKRLARPHDRMDRWSVV